MDPRVFLVFGSAALAAALAVPLLLKRAHDPSWTDAPRADRHATRAVPRLGGPAVLLAWVVGALLCLIHPELRRVDAVAEIGIVLSGVLGAARLGRKDDSGGLEPKPKLLAQLALLVAALLFLLGRRPELLDGIPRVAVGVVVAAVVQLALNIFDNIDGALGAHALSAFLVFACVLPEPLSFAALAAAGAALGFLCWNRPPARVYLGNFGSQIFAFLAALFSGLLIARSGASGGGPGVMFALLPLLWPLFDLAFVVVRRARAGVPPWTGDRGHTTHLLARRLGSDARLFPLLLFVPALLGAIAWRLVSR